MELLKGLFISIPIGIVIWAVIIYAVIRLFNR